MRTLNRNWIKVGLAAFTVITSSCSSNDGGGDSIQLVYKGTEELTTVSGIESQTPVVLAPTNPNSGIVGISWAEDNGLVFIDKPCLVEVSFLELNSLIGDDEIEVQTLDLCTGGAFSESSSRSVGLPARNFYINTDAGSSRIVDGQDVTLFANRINACTNNDRLKGIQLGGSFVTGIVPNPSDYMCKSFGGGLSVDDFQCHREEHISLASVQQTNCSGFSSDNLVRCPPGTIAKELIVHGGEFSGLQLNCDTAVFE